MFHSYRVTLLNIASQLGLNSIAIYLPLKEVVSASFSPLY